jgi:hypothetical protein
MTNRKITKIIRQTRILVFGFLIALLHPATAADYENLFTGKFGAGFHVDDKQVVIGDLAYGLEKCKTGNLSPCIKTERFIFYVPREFPSIRIWYKDGANYRLKSSRSGYWRNTETPIHVIEQSWQGNTLHFAYSKEFGVLAIHAGDPVYQITLLDTCGFAAMPDSRHCAGALPK